MPAHDERGEPAGGDADDDEAEDFHEGGGKGEGN
jgi:hypothetical protein